MDKVIRATIQIEVPYSNELMNYGTKLDKELRKVIDNTPFLNCHLEAGSLQPNGNPTIRSKEKWINRDRATMKGMYIPEHKDET